jgi:hypothetical protein
VGSGFRTFTAGEVLTASNVQNYLMDQSVMVFGGSAARSSAIGTANFEEGMVSYLTDTDKVEAYNGTNWAQVGASAQGLTLINTTSFSAVSSISLPASTFTSTYTNYFLEINKLISTSGNVPQIRMRMRASGVDTTVNYNYGGAWGRASSDNVIYYRSQNDSSIFLGYANASNIRFSASMYLDMPNLANDTLIKYMTTGDDNTSMVYGSGGALVPDSTQYDSLTLFPSVSTISGTMSIYGLNK